jgi:hypothetical protein
MEIDKFWRLNAKFRRFYIQELSDKIDESKYNDDYWTFFVEMFTNSIKGKNYLCFKLLFMFETVTAEAVSNRFFHICHLKKDYGLFISDSDQMTYLYPTIFFWPVDYPFGSSKLIPPQYYEKIVGSIDFTLLANEINMCDDESLEKLFPKGYKKWKEELDSLNTRKQLALSLGITWDTPSWRQ